MADRTSAGIFSELFMMFAVNATNTDKEYAHRVWAMAWQYDFSFQQMECDEALVRLGLARPGFDDGFPIHEYVDTEGHWE